MDKIKDVELEYATLQENYLGRAAEWLLSKKKLGVKLPTLKELQDGQMETIYTFLEKTPFEVQAEVDFDCISPRTLEERNEEALELIRPFISYGDLQKSRLYLDKCTIEREELGVNQKQIEYTLYQGKIFPSYIFVSPIENTVQSVVLASTLAEVIQNQNPLELQNLCITGEIIPLFLKNVFASRLSEIEENTDLKEAIDILEFWNFLQDYEYYKALLSMGDDPNQMYLKRVNMLQSIYPYMNGYVETLKLQKRYKESKKDVLKKIKSILKGSLTTEEVLTILDTKSISTEKVLEEKVKQFQKKK